MSLPHDPCEVFLDARGHGRALRLSWHHESGVVVLSLWRDGVCAATFRLPKAEVNEFVDALVDGLRDDELVDARGRHGGPPATGGVATTTGVSVAGSAPSFTSWALSDSPDRHAAAG